MPETLSTLPPDTKQFQRRTAKQEVGEEPRISIERSEVYDLVNLLTDWKKMPYRLTEDDYNEMAELTDALRALHEKVSLSVEEEEQLAVLTKKFADVRRTKWNNMYRNNWAAPTIEYCQNFLDADAGIEGAEVCRAMLDAAQVAGQIREQKDLAEQYIDGVQTTARHILFDLARRGHIPRAWLLESFFAKRDPREEVPPAAQGQQLSEMERETEKSFRALPALITSLQEEVVRIQDVMQKAWIAEELKKIEEETKAAAA